MNKFEEHENLKNEDYRLGFLSTVAKTATMPNGMTYEPGSVVKIIATGLYSAGKPISFGLPNVSAMYLDFALKNHNSSFEKLNTLDYVRNKDETRLHVDNNKEVEYFDSLEERIASIIFSYTAIETYVNALIPDDYIYIKVRSDGRNEERYNKEQIERFLPLKEKIQSIITVIKDKTLPKDSKVWQDFLKLEQDRNRLVHVKSNDAASKDEYVDTLWQLLVKKACPFYPQFAYNLMVYFDNPDNKTRWLAKFPELSK